ncbi:MAG: HIT domain-containing protein [Dehalococcoidia bacterium]
MADCLFCNMASGEMQVPKLYEDYLVFSIRDIHPRAPTHVMVIPREHIPTALDLTDAHAAMLGRLFEAAAKVARQEELDERGYRLAFNVGDHAGMTIPHLHLHMVGGRRLGPEG